jgi:hypothetical protein
MAGLNNGLLETLFTAAVKERQDAVADGASWSEDPRWAIATLKEAWCGAKLGKARGVISKDAADSIVRKIEAFAFDSKHAG